MSRARPSFLARLPQAVSPAPAAPGRDGVPDGARVHVAPAPRTRVPDVASLQGVGAKPAGCWWAHRADWLAWCALEMPTKVTSHIYHVVPGADARLAVLASAADLRAFTAQFAAAATDGPCDESPGRPWHLTAQIDWARVAAAYDGVDVRDLTAWGPADARGARTGLMPGWLHGAQRWDVPSGCLWRPTRLTRLDPVPLDTVRGWFAALDEPLPPALVPVPARVSAPLAPGGPPVRPMGARR